MTGEGKITYKKGGFYDGQFLKGKFHGLGKRVFPNGSTLKGLWKNGIFIKKEELD